MKARYPITNPSDDLKKESLKKGISLRDSRATGKELEEDLSNTRKQAANETWADEHLTEALKKLQNIKPFEEIQQ